MYSRILIPLDGSGTAEGVLPYGRALARRLKLSVELLGIVHVAEMAGHLAAEKTRYLDTLITEGERSSGLYLERIARSFSGTVKCTVERGNPEEQIIAAAATDTTTLIAMATHGRSGISRWLLGSVAEKVLRGASGPLLLVRSREDAIGEAEANLTSIMVPLDGSALAETVLPKAVQMAKTFAVEMILLRAYELPASAYYGSEDYLPDYEALKEEVKKIAQGYLDGKVSALGGEGLKRISTVLIEGSGANEIINVAHQHPHTLIAMCSHGRSGMKRWMLGSVTEKVVRHADAPVLVVRAG